jgi:aminoglycoside/choline kinase family phosphotransferase
VTAPPPREELARFLQDSFPGAAVEPLTGDASARRFFRLRPPGGPTRVVMDYGDCFTGETGDQRANRLFEAAGLPVARILGVEPDPGCLILEDLGDLTLDRAVAGGSPADRGRLYDAAVDLAAEIRVEGTRALRHAERERWPALDSRRFRFEMDYFMEHYARGFASRTFLPSSLERLLHELADRAADTMPRVLCHRDFHSRNLMVLAGGSLAMVDIQDARWGPDTYDLASLVRDGYVDLEEVEVDRLLERYRRALPDAPAPEMLRSRFDVVAAQRMIKALGTFGYQVGRLGRERYRGAIPRTLDRLRRLLPASPETAALSRALDEAGLLAEPAVQ